MGFLGFRVQITILPTCSPLWHTLKSSLTAFPTLGLAMCIKDKHQILSCSNPSSIWQSVIFSKCELDYVTSLLNIVQCTSEKTYKAYFVDLSPKLDFYPVPSCLLQNLTPPSFPHFSLVQQYAQVSSTVIKALL